MHTHRFSFFSSSLNALNADLSTPEDYLIKQLINEYAFSPDQSATIQKQTLEFIQKIRASPSALFSVEKLLQLYTLSSEEGLALMSLAESLLRIPDDATRSALIRDKIGSINWCKKAPSNSDFLSKASGFVLKATQSLLGVSPKNSLKDKAKIDFNEKQQQAPFKNFTRVLSEPIITPLISHFIKQMGHQFVRGETIENALKCSNPAEHSTTRYSYDMLGESAKTKQDAQHYYAAYHHAIKTLANHTHNGDIFSQASISIKLSALHPRYELSKWDSLQKELMPDLIELARAAKTAGIGLTIDAEESERLLLSLALMEQLAHDKSLKNWDGLGLAVQAYQKRATKTIEWLKTLAVDSGRRLCIRLVKGAYWDSEIKKTQEQGFPYYPVFTQKSHTDVSYLACAQKMLAAPTEIYSQFATHNAHTIAGIMELRPPHCDSEFQRLHGMGEALYTLIDGLFPCRVYAPVGNYKDLLAYLVRRLLENGANSSFVHKIQDPTFSPDSLSQNPFSEALKNKCLPHPKIPLPQDLFKPERTNSRGLDLNDPLTLHDLYEKIEATKKTYPLKATPVLGLHPPFPNEDPSSTTSIVNPANADHVVGTVKEATINDSEHAIDCTSKAFPRWSLTSVNYRAQLLENLGKKLEDAQAEFMAVLIHEAGKTIPDALAEVREAIDFCRYYAQQARLLMANPLSLPGPTGEINELQVVGRGTFVCISPWNFPLAIFLGQIAAALVTGNCVIAKPAQQTPLVAYKICQLAYKCGIPKDVLCYLPAPGQIIGNVLLPDHRVSGVAFTGSTTVGWTINQILSQRRCAIAPLIAETGGINALIADSSALPEQVVADVLSSAFQSAGQRCSALRLLFLQEDTADRVLTLLTGAMKELTVGNPESLWTDIGPLMDRKALAGLDSQRQRLSSTAQLIYEVPLSESLKDGAFTGPQIWSLPHANSLEEEIFGPVLGVVRFKAAELPAVIDQINQKGYGLTLGLHTRIYQTIDYVRRHAHVGNLYVNRNIIGAVVGVQPFGGEGLSGTGPKAGGPHYLQKFTTERTFTVNTTAAGGNASLLINL